MSNVSSNGDHKQAAIPKCQADKEWQTREKVHGEKRVRIYKAREKRRKDQIRERLSPHSNLKIQKFVTKLFVNSWDADMSQRHYYDLVESVAESLTWERVREALVAAEKQLAGVILTDDEDHPFRGIKRGELRGKVDTLLASIRHFLDNTPETFDVD